MSARDVNRRLEQVTDGITAASEAGLVDLAVQIMQLAQRLVPRLTGKLAASAYISLARSGLLEFGYGTDYAPDVHQGDGRGRMWLQQAVMTFTGENGLQHVAKKVQQAASGGFKGGVRDDAAEFARSPHGD